MAAEPKTLQEAIVYFSTPENCIDYIANRRWPKGVICPTCGSDKVSFLKNQMRWQCSSRHPKRQFSVKVGTIFEDSPLGLDKWLPCVWLVTNCKNGISSWEIHRALGVTQKTAWFMLHRVRLAHQGKNGGKLDGQVEVDESFIGGKSRNMHKGIREKRIKARGPFGKAVVMGLLERHGEVRAHAVPDTSQKVLQGHIKDNVHIGADVFTDAHPGYFGVEESYAHGVIDHAEAYVNGQIHTNGLENFWSLLKRGLNGTYVSVEPFHLFRYVHEQAFRHNNRRDMNDLDRFSKAVSQIVGKRLTYAELTGKVGETEAF
jgi:transposase-like protein